jgi:RNA polymerase sigma factor (sigma-70 family)
MTVTDGPGGPSDGVLLARVLARSIDRDEAWRALVRRHSPRLYAVARSFSLDAATSEDLVQTAWLRLLERGDQIRDASALSPWLCTIVRNEARKLVTRRRVVPSDVVVDTPARDDEPPGEALLVRERAAALRAAFGALGEECRQLLRLMCADPPLSYDELAVVVGRPRGSLGPTRRRCLDQLRSRLPEGIR